MHIYDLSVCLPPLPILTPSPSETVLLKARELDVLQRDGEKSIAILLSEKEEAELL